MEKVKFRTYLDKVNTFYVWGFGGAVLECGSYPTFLFTGILSEEEYHNRYTTQFTGLVDKDGKDIFSGHVLEYQSQSVLDSLSDKPMRTFRKVIKWNEEELCWWVGDEDGFKPNLTTDNGKFLIVGNIFNEAIL